MSKLGDSLRKFDELTDEHSCTPVPESKAVSGIQIGLLCIGISITLPGLYSGGELGQNLGLTDGIIASLLGGLILSIMSVPAAVIGVKTRLSSYMIIEHVFGRHGAKPVNLIFGLVLLGWYAVTAELFGRTLFLAAQEYTTLLVPEWQFTLVSSILVIATSIFGFKAIDRLAIVAVPLLLLFLVYVAGLSLEQSPVQGLWTIDKQAIDMPTAISAVVGTMIVNVVLMPDLSRYARTVKNCVTASFLGNGFGSAISMILAMVPALVFNELDPMKYMTVLGLTGIAFFVLVFATWTTNTANLYSAGLVTGTALPSVGYWIIILGGGVLGTIFALIGVAEYLIPFLVVLGLVVPPVAGVYLTDFFLLKRTDFSPAHLANAPTVNWKALTASILGGGSAAWAHYADVSLTGIGPLEALFAAAIIYLALEFFSKPIPIIYKETR